MAIEKSVSGEKGPVISVTIGVSLGTGADESTTKGIQPGYGKTYLSRRYLSPAADDEVQVFGVGGDTEYVVDADAVSRPVDVARLSDPWYAVQSVVRRNEAPYQVNRATHLGYLDQDPRWAVQRNPTRVTVTMKPLKMEGVLSRDVYIGGDVLTSPRGIDLINGEEP